MEILKPLRYKVDLLGGSRAQVRRNVSLNIRHRHRIQLFFSCDKLKLSMPLRRFCRVNFDGGNVVVKWACVVKVMWQNVTAQCWKLEPSISVEHRRLTLNFQGLGNFSLPPCGLCSRGVLQLSFSICLSLLPSWKTLSFLKQFLVCLGLCNYRLYYWFLVWAVFWSTNLMYEFYVRRLSFRTCSTKGKYCWWVAFRRPARKSSFESSEKLFVR